MSGEVSIPTLEFERFIAAARVVRSIPDEGYSEPVAVEMGDVEREFLVQGRIIENVGDVSISVRVNERSARPFELNPGDKLYKLYTRIYATWAKREEEPTKDAYFKTYSTADVERSRNKIKVEPSETASRDTVRSALVPMMGMSIPLAADQPVPAGFGARIKAPVSNVGAVLVGGVAPAYPLEPGAEVTLLVRNLSNVFAVGAPGDAVAWIVEV